MRKIFLVMVLTMPYFLIAQNSLKGIHWVEGLTWNQLKQKAKAENKFIFVDAYTTWCGPCKKMDKEIYVDEKVGDVINTRFIPVKVQMDKTDKDDEAIKAMYVVAQLLNEYRIDGYPSFLFFAPDGKLAYKDVGYRDVDEFVALAKDALTDPNARYDKEIEKYKSGQLPYTQMRELARDAWYKKKDKKMAVEIAKKYKTEYADKLNNDSAYTKENLYFIAEFYSDIDLSSKDRYFKFFYKNLELADSIIDCIRGGKPVKLVPNVLRGTIRREEITENLYNDGKPITGLKPDWKKIKKSIQKKYGNSYSDQFFPDEQIKFYQNSKEWDNYVKYVNQKIEMFPPKKGGKLFGGSYGDAWGLNGYAWDLFKGCNDKAVLVKGLPWVDKSLQLAEGDPIINEYMDTKANLLYRAGRVFEAIALEQKAVELSKNAKDVVENLKKMKAGIPTWPEM